MPVKIRDKNENVFLQTNGLREKAKAALSLMGPGPARKKDEVYQYGRVEEE